MQNIRDNLLSLETIASHSNLRCIVVSDADFNFLCHFQMAIAPTSPSDSDVP